MAALILGLLYLSGLATRAYAAEMLDQIVAVVDDEVIMQSELDRYMSRVREELQQRGTELPPQAILEKQVLDRLILTKIQLELAKRTGIKVDDETLNAAIADIATRNKMNIDQFRGVLEKQGYDFSQFREDIRDQITVARLKQRDVDNRINVTDREIDNYLANRHGQTSGKEYRLSHILIATPEGATPEQIQAARKKAENALKELKGGADFKKLAVTISDGQQALEGGDLGWRKAGEIPTIFADDISHMQKGDISDVIQSPSGFHIIMLSDLRSEDVHVVTQTHVRHILIKPTALISKADARTKLEQLRMRLEGGADFAELARSNSDDRGSAANGGDLGWVNPGELVPDFEQVMNGLKPGEISEPFETEFGLHIVQVLGRRQHDDTTEAKRAQAREAIRQRKIEEETQAWLRRLRDEAYVEYRLPGMGNADAGTGTESDTLAVDHHR